jgi:hypothetical protein
MRNAILGFALLAALFAFGPAPAYAQGRDISPRIDTLQSQEELRAARERDAKLKKKKKDDQPKAGAPSGSGGY